MGPYTHEEAGMSGKYSKLLVFWGVIFVLSLLFIFTGLGTSLRIGSGGLIELDRPTVAPEEGAETIATGFNWGIALAVITAVASGGGFIATTYFAIREDRRDAAIHQLQIASLKKEIEHKDLEIARLRQEREQDSDPWQVDV
jgi:hypothetical protein